MSMENLGLNNDVLVGGRKFHVQTNFSPSKNAIVANVFEDGIVIDSQEVAVSEDLSESASADLIQETHQELITEMEILYYINEKVMSVRHAASANRLGLLFLQKNLLQDAIQQFKLALDIDPNFSEVFANLGKAQLMSNLFDDAVVTLKKGAQQAPDYADIQHYLGMAYLYKEDYDSAVSRLETAIKLNPQYPGGHFHFGIALLAKSLGAEDLEADRERALAELGKADGMARERHGHFDNVMQKVKDQQFEAAVNEFLMQRPVETLSALVNIENEFYLKFMYGGKGKDDSFISDYVNNLREIIEEHPDYADVRNNMGVANLIQCRNLFLKALDEFRTALKINPNFKKAEKNLKLAENDGKGFLILLRAILK